MSNASSSVALVTGASSGIGAAIASHLVAHGYTVHGTSTKAAVARSQPPRLMMHVLDVRDQHAVDAVVGDVVRQSGGIDVLVNNAGVGLAGALEETTIPEAKDLFDINFFGPMRVTLAVLPY